jgi:hypothetical protein
VAGTPAVTIDGGPKLARAFDRMSDRVGDLASTHAAAADPVVATARSLVPIVSGALLDTIRREDITDGSAVVAGSDQVRYAGPIHYGWPARNIDAQPFLDDAMTYEQDNVTAVYDATVDEAIRTFDREAP